MTVVESNSVNLTASFSGLPLPNVTLHRNGTQLTSLVETDRLSYELAGVTKLDAGNYTFRASNLIGQVESDVQLTVHCKSGL